MWRSIIASALLVTISGTMAAIFAGMWFVDAVKVAEPNIAIRISELVFFLLVLLLGIERLIRFSKM